MIVGIGADLIEVNRIEEIFNRWETKFINRILSYKESKDLLLLKTKRRNINISVFLAKKFVAKEAIAKALGLGIRSPVNFKSIGITNNFLGKPLVVLEGKLKNYCSRENYVIHVSISDQKNIAQAFAVVEIIK